MNELQTVVEQEAHKAEPIPDEVAGMFMTAVDEQQIAHNGWARADRLTHRLVTALFGVKVPQHRYYKDSTGNLWRIELSAKLALVQKGAAHDE